MKLYSKRLTKIVTALLISVSALQARAELLLDKVPADALGFVAWQGSMGPGYEGSNFQQIMQASGLWQKLAQMEKGPKKDDIAAAQMFFGAPSVCCILKLDADKSKSQFVMISKIGPMAQTLASKINENKNPDLNARDEGDLLILEIGQGTHYTTGTGGITNAPAFKSALAQTSEQPAAILYLDCEKVLRAIDGIVTTTKSANERRGWAMASDVMGIDGFKQLIWTGRFAEKGWETQTFIALSPTRSGLTSFFDNKPLSPGAMSVAPAQASWQGIYRFDATRFINDLRDGVSRVDPNAGQQFDGALQMGKQTMGFDLENDLAASLGEEWTYFSVSTEGQFHDNMVFVNTLRNVDGAAKSLQAAGKFIGMQMARQGNGKGFESRTVDGIELNVMTLPKASPTWAIEEGKLLFALNPDAILAARKQFAGADESRKTSSENIAGKIAGLHKGALTSYSYSDLAKFAPIAIANMKAEFINKNAQETANLFPAADAIAPALTPAYSACWQDEAGWHSTGREPFPFASMLIELAMMNNQPTAPATQPAK